MDIFPDLPGFDIEKTRASQFATSVQTSASGKELRATFMTGAPRFEYTLKLNVARRASWADAPQDEILALLKCYNAARGKLNPLLLVDPVNGNTEKVVFATADGTSTSYQLADDEGWPAQNIRSAIIYAGGFVPGSARPWTFEGGKNSAYTWQSMIGEEEWTVGECLPSICPVTPGQTLEISATGINVWRTTSGPSGYVPHTAGPDGKADSSGYTLWPSNFVGHALSDPDKWGLIGAFTDAVGNVIEPVWIGSSASLLVPAGAAQLQFGTNSLSHIDAAGAFWVTINGNQNAFFKDVQETCLVYRGDPYHYIDSYSIDSSSGAIVMDSSAWGINAPEGVVLTWSGQFARKARFVDDSLSIKQIVEKLFSGDSIKLVSLK